MFQIHWSLVDSPEAACFAPPGYQLLALWPAPVNHDACFADAGFELFGDNDEEWDKSAEAFLERTLAMLCTHGDMVLHSKPLTRRRPWFSRAFGPEESLRLAEQALMPMHWDSLPPFHARFGPGHTALRTGNGHFLLWLTLPSTTVDEAAQWVRELAAPWPAVHTALKWGRLLPSAA